MKICDNYLIICDETNNTQEDMDNNLMNVDIYFSISETKIKNEWDEYEI